jgi:hypothetical protein
MALRKPLQLQQEEPDRVRHERGVNKKTVQELLAAAVQKRADALRKENSGPTRLEAAYDAILFCALAIFAARGLRVATAFGHHRLLLEGLGAELSVSVSTYDEIELLREVRNSKYTGLLNVAPADLKLSAELLERVMNETQGWFQKNKPDMLKR